jgi:hypothetical protein
MILKLANIKTKIMKRKITILLSMIILTLFIANCATGKKQMNDAMNNVYIGMNITDFNKIFPKKELVSMNEGITIYKVNKRLWYENYDSEYRYCYFQDNKLVQVDKGIRDIKSVRIVNKSIRIDKN